MPPRPASSSSAATSWWTSSTGRACPGISAVGDVISFGKPGHPQLAHVSTAEGIAVAERIAGQEPRTVNYDQVPGCTFCDPEIGSIGLTEQKAQGARLRRGGRHLPLHGARPREDRRRDRGLREDRRRQEVRRGARRAHHRAAGHRPRSPRRRSRCGSSAPARSWSARFTRTRPSPRRSARPRTRCTAARFTSSRPEA